ncbi:tRNA (adenine-N1)-methyltransferase [Nanoarchaeota archaeon]
MTKKNKEIKKVLINKEKKYYIRDLSNDYHSNDGYIKAAELKKAKDGTLLKTNKGKEFSIFSAGFQDKYEKLDRSAQIIPKKDLGTIISYTGIGKDSVIVDAGTGSGALCCFLANIAKKVVSYDVREDHQEFAERNVKLLGLKNVTLKIKDISTGIDEKNIDMISLDLPDPWMAIESCAKALKVGGYIISYSPTIPQVSDFVEAVNDREELIHLQTIEIVEREWQVEGRRVRPKTQQIGHSGFLSFARKVKK